MSPVYGSIAARRTLLARERHVISGRRVATRDDKRRRGPTPRSRRWQVSRPAVLGLVGFLIVALAVGAAVGRDDTPGETTAAQNAPSVRPGDEVSTTGSAPSTTERTASAITLNFTGGRLTREECLNLRDDGACQDFEPNSFDPLLVRCTPDACTVTFISTTALDGPIDVAGTYPHSDVAACGMQRWTLKLQPVGTAVTRGIEHPRRLVGEATVDADPQIVPEANCLGRHTAYVYDAEPGG